MEKIYSGHGYIYNYNIPTYFINFTINNISFPVSVTHYNL